MIESHPEIIEMDLNPIIYSYDTGQILVADARMTVGT